MTTNYTPDYDTRPYEAPELEPSDEQMREWELQEFIAHFSTPHGDTGGPCSFCYDEWELREHGIEDDTLMLVALVREAARGDLAGAPDEMECLVCPEGSPWRGVVRLGPVVNPADPTQTYVLDCGHTTI